jgi:enamine deaminase RidA (YjgF/YER057c/UK114 family)
MIKRYGKMAIMHQVVEHEGVLYLAGVVAEDASAGMQGQTEQILTKIDRILAEHGSGKHKILSATAYITDMAQKPAMNEAWTAWFDPDHLPTRATIGVAELGPNLLIEIVVVAAR